jgi:hypothetical protein
LYENLLSGKFQIQRNPTIKKGQSELNPCSEKIEKGVLELEYKGKG